MCLLGGVVVPETLRYSMVSVTLQTFNSKHLVLQFILRSWDWGASISLINALISSNFNKLTLILIVAIRQKRAYPMACFSD